MIAFLVTELCCHSSPVDILLEAISLSVLIITPRTEMLGILSSMQKYSYSKENEFFG